MTGLYRVVFSSTVAARPKPIATAAMSRDEAMRAFAYQAAAQRFSAWGGTERMRVLSEDEWQIVASRGAS